jgi:MFS family permease
VTGPPRRPAPPTRGPATRGSPSSARLSISLAFVLHAAVSGTWGPRLPALKADAGLSDGELGLALFGMAVGLLAGTRSAGAPIERYGSRLLLRVGIPLLAAALLLPALAQALLPLAAGFFVLGFVSGGLDVAMNAHGVDVERELDRPILNGLHGLWSVGLGLGAAVAAVAAALDAEPLVHFAVVGVTITAVSVPALRGLLRADHVEPEASRPSDAAISPWAPVVLVLGAVAFAAFVGEGSMNDWSAVYLREGLDTSAGLAAVGFGAFAVAMAASRFAGDRLAMRIGPVALVRIGGVTAAVGLGLGLAIDEPASVIVGSALFGAGLAPVVPTAFSAAGHLDGPGGARVLGRVVTFGYVGSVLGPLVIGGVAEVLSLRVALLLPVLLAAAIVLGAGSVAPARES